MPMRRPRSRSPSITALRVVLGGVAGDDHDRGGGPAERGGPGVQAVVDLAADQRVHDQRLQPGVPGAARLGLARVDLGGGERHVAGVAEHGLLELVLAARRGQLVGLRLDHLDDDPDDVDGLLQRDRRASARAARCRRTRCWAWAGPRPACWNHSTNAAIPACATRPTQERSSAVSARNHGSRSSIRDMAAVPSVPMARSSLRVVSSRVRSVTPPRVPGPAQSRVTATAARRVVIRGGQMTATAVIRPMPRG